MIMLPRDYQTAESYTGETAAKLPAGAYVCEIKGARVETIGQSGAQKFVLAIDICEGEHAGYFTKLFERAKSQGAGAKWRGTYEVFLLKKEGTTNPFFKGMITCIDKSNAPFQAVQGGQINEALLKGKKIGLLFREEEYLKDGQTRTAVKAFAAMTVDDIRKGGIPVPEKKTLEGQSEKPAQTVKHQPPDKGFTRIEDEDLPF